MVTIDLVLVLLAFLCFTLAAFGVASPRVQLTPLGLALWMLSLIL